MKWLKTSLPALLVLAISGCIQGFLSPEEVARQSFSCPPGSSKLIEFRVREVQRWSRGMVILYSALCGNQGDKQSQQVVGHKVIKHSSRGWQSSSSDVYESDPLPSSDQLVEYSISKSVTGGNDRYIVLYGQALKPAVLAVEASFDNGKTVRQKVNDGVFALISPGAKGVCEVRLIGADNQILKRDDLAKLYQPSSLVQHRGVDCLPFTLQL